MRPRLGRFQKGIRSICWNPFRRQHDIDDTVVYV